MAARRIRNLCEQTADPPRRPEDEAKAGPALQGGRTPLGLRRNLETTHQLLPGEPDLASEECCRLALLSALFGLTARRPPDPSCLRRILRRAIRG
eukprot:10049385-Alexandrium_andersonii.AAC.1